MKTYTVAGHELRGFEADGELWFVGKDVAKALGTNPASLQWGLQSNEERLIKIETSGGPQAMKAVSAAGLLSLVFRSKKAEATAFRRWAYGLIVPYVKLRVLESKATGPNRDEERLARRSALKAFRHPASWQRKA